MKGHQDDYDDIMTLDIWGQLNVVADVDAKATLWDYIAKDTPDILYKHTSSDASSDYI